MRASLVTDVAQSVTCVGFLIALLIVLGVNAPAGFGSWNGAGTADAQNHTYSSTYIYVCM